MRGLNTKCVVSLVLPGQVREGESSSTEEPCWRCWYSYSEFINLLLARFEQEHLHWDPHPNTLGLLPLWPTITIDSLHTHTHKIDPNTEHKKAEEKNKEVMKPAKSDTQTQLWLHPNTKMHELPKSALTSTNFVDEDIQKMVIGCKNTIFHWIVQGNSRGNSWAMSTLEHVVVDTCSGFNWFMECSVNG